VKNKKKIPENKREKARSELEKIHLNGLRASNKTLRNINSKNNVKLKPFNSINLTQVDDDGNSTMRYSSSSTLMNKRYLTNLPTDHTSPIKMR